MNDDYPFSVADEDEESKLKTLILNLCSVFFFLIGGRVTLDYDENMARHRELFSFAKTLENKASLCINTSIV